MERIGSVLGSLAQASTSGPAGKGGSGLGTGLGLGLAWSLAAGPKLARRARCRGLAGCVLRLELTPATESARRHIASVEPEICFALNRILGAGTVRRIAFEG